MRIDNPSILGTLQLQNNSRSDLSGSFTGSFLGTLDGTALTASYVQGTAVEGFTAFSSSASERISDLETFSSSLDTVYATDTELGSVSSSIVSTISTVSSSFSSRVTTNETNISTLTSQTSSYLLNTTDTLDGDLTVTGKITAQEFHTEFVSASILYQSGSVKLGDSVDDRISVTGSIFITRGAIMNPAILEESITIPSNYNGLLVSPITNPETITVESNANLVIV